jgi:ABC-type dipeptide/oligopeptide/nickel transport system permease subunit
VFCRISYGSDISRVLLHFLRRWQQAVFPAHAVLSLRFAVFAEGTLAFLGLGDPSAASWGSMLGWAFANPLLFTSPAWTWLVLPPALGIGLLLLVSGPAARIVP